MVQAHGSSGTYSKPHKARVLQYFDLQQNNSLIECTANYLKSYLCVRKAQELESMIKPN